MSARLDLDDVARGNPLAETELATLRRLVEAQAAEIARLQERDAKLLSKQGTFKGTGDPALDACLLAEDPAFIAFRDSLPATHWARYDLSAVRLGWHYGQARKDAEIERLRALLTRYRDETPLGHQPHMIAHVVDEALGRNNLAVDVGPTPLRGRVTRRDGE